MLVQERAGERPLGYGLAKHRVTLWRQDSPPISIAVNNREMSPGACTASAAEQQQTTCCCAAETKHRSSIKRSHARALAHGN